MARERHRREPRAEIPPAEHVARELDRHAQVLRELVAGSGRSEAEIEARLDWPPGCFRRLLCQPQELLYGDLFAILAAVGVAPKRYFDLVASPETER